MDKLEEGFGMMPPGPAADAVGAAYLEALGRSNRQSKFTYMISVLEGWVPEQTQHYIQTGHAPPGSALSMPPTDVPDTDPVIHTFHTDQLPTDHPKAFESVECGHCGDLVHAFNNECMQVWVEWGKCAVCWNCLAINTFGSNDGGPHDPFDFLSFKALATRRERELERQKVDSSNIDSIGFDPGPPSVLEIQFKGGGVYQYRSDDDSVVKQHYEDLMKAESKGRHFTAHVRHDKRLKVTKVDKAAPGQGGGAQ